MATFTVTTTTKPSGPPTTVGNIKLEMPNGGSYIFTIATITTETYPQYLDPQGDAVSKFKLLSTTYDSGVFQLNGVDLAIGTEVDAADIAAGLLTFEDDGTNPIEHDSDVEYTLSDVGSNTFSSDSGIIRIAVAEQSNLPPTEIGDGAESIGFGESLVFTRAMFTTSTTPAYSDPEGDSADKLKFRTLPSTGQIKLNGLFVSVNQEIDFTDIDAGLLVYVGDLSAISGGNDSFEFEIADSESGIFVS